MCGIVASIGTKGSIGPILVGLGRLEYRGYDSAGVAGIVDGAIQTRKAQGRVATLAELLVKKPLHSSVAIGHTRWATHGVPSDVNAHPHHSGDVSVVHNGTIENFTQLRDVLRNEGYVFMSETDTEVLPHLVNRAIKYGASSLTQAVAQALKVVEGKYAIAVISSRFPNEMVAACYGQSLVVGRGSGALYASSDVQALAGYADDVIYIHDGELVTLRRDGTLQIGSETTEQSLKRLVLIPVSEADVDKGSFAHWMLKEIYDQPAVMHNVIDGRIIDGHVVFSELSAETVEALRTAKNVDIVACGTSYYSGLDGKYAIEKLARVRVSVETASEYQYRSPIVDTNTVAIFISQSGETADTIAAMAYAKAHGAHCIALTNNVNTNMGRSAHAEIGVRAGGEKAVASTKAFVAQVAALTLLAVFMGEQRKCIDESERKLILDGLQSLPKLISDVLTMDPIMKSVAEMLVDAKRVMYIGRGFMVPLASEGSLKLKEVAIIDSEGYPSGELKHGPIALVAKDVPIIALALEGAASLKTINNVMEVAARQGTVVAVVTKGSEEERLLRKNIKHVLTVPRVPEELSAIVAAPLMQLFAYHMGVMRGKDVDKPENLAKSVTVE